MNFDLGSWVNGYLFAYITTFGMIFLGIGGFEWWKFLFIILMWASHTFRHFGGDDE